MEISATTRLALSGKRTWPNLFVFPKELKQAIPEYGARALIFDSVSGSTYNLFAQILDTHTAPRAQAQFVVHESGKLNGGFVLSMDLDSATMRALGEFLVGLADRAEAQNG